MGNNETDVGNITGKSLIRILTGFFKKNLGYVYQYTSSYPH